MNTKNIFLIGSMAAGKTTVGKQLAQKLHLDFYDSDKEIEKRTGTSIPWIFDLEGEAGFRKRESQVIADLTAKAGIVLATGGGVVLNAENRKFLAARGYVVYLQISLEEQLLRTKKSYNRPLLLNNADPKATLEELQAKRQPLYEEIANYTISTRDRTIADIVDEIIRSRLQFSM